METKNTSTFTVAARRSPYFFLRGDDPSEHNVKIGSSLKGTSVLRGLSHDEERKYLPSIINVSPKDVEWRRAATEYWNNIGVKVPADGATNAELQGKVMTMVVAFKNAEQVRTFESLVDFEERGNFITNNGEVIEGIADYVLFKYCLVYGRVANKFADIKASEKIRFYLYSIETANIEKREEFKTRADANNKFYQILSDEARIDAALLNFEKDLKLFPSIEDKHMALEEEIKLKPKEFLKLMADVNLNYKSFILRAANAGILYVPDNTESYYYGENREVLLGTSLDDAVLFIKSDEPKNVQIKDAIKARLKN